MKCAGALTASIAIFSALLPPQAFARGAHLSFEDSTCAPEGVVRFICGRSAPEDIAPIPGTDWVVSSAFTGAVGLHLNNAREERLVATLYPSPNARKKQDMALFGACPGPLTKEQEASFVAHGIYLRQLSATSFTLYSVGHGPRESVEVFHLDVEKGKAPIITWIGCAVAPGHETFNSVALLPDDGFVVSNTFEKRADFKVSKAWSFFGEFSGDPLIDSGVPGYAAKRAAHEDTGYILEWRPGSGWSKVPGSDGPGDSALEASQDGKFIYFAIDGARLVKLSRGQTPPKKDIFSTGGLLPDNMKWSADGRKLLVAGSVPAPGDAQPDGRVLEVDPDTFQVKDLIHVPVRLTTGIEVGKNLWLGSSRGLRITIVPTPAQR